VNLKFICAVALATTGAAHGVAQTADKATDSVTDTAVPVSAAATPTPIAPCCKLAALTPVEFEILTAASSKSSHQGDAIRIRVREDVRVDGKVVIPAGTEGVAEVIQSSPGRFGGKAGELVIGAPYLTLGTQRINLKRFGYGPSSGRDRFGQTVVATALVGIAGMLIQGGNIDVASGAPAHAVVTADTFVPLPTQISSKE
jgi:hypothetical protein